MRTTIALAVLLLALPAHAAMVICTKADGTKYVGPTPPVGCEVERSVSADGRVRAGSMKPGTRLRVQGPQTVGDFSATAPLWDSRESVLNCLTTSLRAESRDCDAAIYARLTTGTEVEALPPSEECGDFATVRVLGGKAAGATGCLNTNFAVPIVTGE